MCHSELHDPNVLKAAFGIISYKWKISGISRTSGSASGEFAEFSCSGCRLLRWITPDFECRSDSGCVGISGQGLLPRWMKPCLTAPGVCHWSSRERWRLIYSAVPFLEGWSKINWFPDCKTNFLFIYSDVIMSRSNTVCLIQSKDISIPEAACQ